MSNQGTPGKTSVCALQDHCSQLAQTSLSPHMLDMIKGYEEHEALPGLVRKIPEETSRIMCGTCQFTQGHYHLRDSLRTDLCAVSIFSCSFMCARCAYEICPTCHTKPSVDHRIQCGKRGKVHPPLFLSTYDCTEGSADPCLHTYLALC